jgi:NitT/TauT family transport system substrate-binding protein
MSVRGKTIEGGKAMGYSNSRFRARAKSISHILGALAFSTILAGQALAEDVVRLGNLKLAHFGAVSYTSQLGSKCPVKVEERVFAKGTEIMQAILAGEIDVGASGSEAAIAARAGGVPIYIVAGFATGGARFLRRPDLNISTIKELKGKKVGVTRGGIQEVLLAAELAQNGLTWSEQGGKDVDIVYLLYPDLNQALMAKNLDAIMQTEPQSAQAVVQGFGVELPRPYDTPIGSPARTLVMSEKMYDNKAVAAKFMGCFVEATQTFMKDPALAEKYVTQTMFKGQVTSEEFKAAISNAPYSLDISIEHIQITTDAMAKYGIAKMTKPALAGEYVKLDLVEAAKKSAGVK